MESGYYNYEQIHGLAVVYCAQQGQTPLHLAAENDHSDVVKLFLKHRPELVTMANTVSGNAGPEANFILS